MSLDTIRETRQIVLPLQTVLDAVVQYDRRSHGSLSRGAVVQAEFVNGVEESGMHVAVLMPDESVIEWRHFNTDELAAAIINFCRAKRIPLPYAGAKSLSITKEGAAFSIENTVSVSRSANLAADISGRPLRYARGYEPHALTPASRSKVAV
jgi:hypothetical protein